MKNYSLILIGILLLCACKTRQVSITSANQISQSAKTEVQQSNIRQIDTTKNVVHITRQKLQQDSMDIEIIPDTGIIRIVNGNYIGKARSVVIKNSSASLQNTNQVIQQNKGKITQNTLKDSTVQQRSEQLHTKTKQTSATGTDLWFYLIACALVLGAVGVAKVKHWF